MAMIGKKVVSTQEAIAYLNANCADISYDPAYLGPQGAAEAMQALLRQIVFAPRDHLHVFVYGKWRQQARCVAGYGDDGARYQYSGVCVLARAWAEAPTLVQQRELLCERTGFRASFVLINRYLNGADSISAHSDDEKDLGPAPTIHSQSFGAERRFRFRPSRAAAMAAESVQLDLAHGSLLTLRHPTNCLWTHELPKAGGCHPERIGARLNLTWRQVIG